MGEQERKDLKADDAEMMRRLQEELQSLAVSDHLIMMMHSLSALAVGRMGLTAQTIGRRDLEQARLAIDAFRALMELVERVRPAQEMTIHRNALSELQLSFVDALGSGGSADGRTDRPADGPDDVLAEEQPAEVSAEEQQPGGE